MTQEGYTSHGHNLRFLTKSSNLFKSRSPTTLTELEANYRELIKREHPDVSPFAEEEAINRFAYLRSQRSDNQRELASIEAHGDDREGGGARLG